MAKTDVYEHEARTLASGYKSRVKELLDIGYPNPEQRKVAARDFAVAIGALDAPELAAANGAGVNRVPAQNAVGT